jgi:lactoylglutathione lyase
MDEPTADLGGWHAAGLSAMTLFVEDLAVARDFYRRAFEAEPIFEAGDSVVFRTGTTMVNLLTAGGGPGPRASRTRSGTCGRSPAGPRSSRAADPVGSTRAARGGRASGRLPGGASRPGLTSAGYYWQSGLVPASTGANW